MACMTYGLSHAYALMLVAPDIWTSGIWIDATFRYHFS